MKTPIIILIFLSLFVESCEFFGHEDYRLKISNKSGRELYFYEDFNYPDTTIRQRDITKSPSDNKIYIGKEKIVAASSKWETIFNKEIPSDTLMIFFFDASVIENTPWDTVKSQYLVLKRYDLSYDDLVRMDWIITYP